MAKRTILEEQNPALKEEREAAERERAKEEKEERRRSGQEKAKATPKSAQVKCMYICMYVSVCIWYVFCVFLFVVRYLITHRLIWNGCCCCGILYTQENPVSLTVD